MPKEEKKTNNSRGSTTNFIFFLWRVEITTFLYFVKDISIFELIALNYWLLGISNIELFIKLEKKRLMK
ncbi:hypothetical protein CWE03_00645 [Lactobacillus johnsonii]|uniref:Uncharacterized protein n=1 Tax=Lactobacillus johnsonii TaxID=33959 RepID=A0AAW5M172_LACJH|nr:hypothetical protein [Lactobacillus johnsonii]MCR1914699.1 hypothetical protein [Lactobacillus johnsonii]PJN79302.1 hypothetical protein CWE03_00645 [Lactobacillus johnsonii]